MQNMFVGMVGNASPGQQELWENARVAERDDVKRVTDKFTEANKYPEK